MTNHWIDIKNTDAVLIIGSNAAEHHPVAFKWIMRARDNGAVLMHVDPKFSRTSARCDFHVPLRSGTDIPFLGGMINYILENNLYFKDYVLNYTNAAFVVGEGYGFKDGLFTGYDPKTRSYDKSKWGLAKGPDGGPVIDPTLKNERCVLNLMRQHYSRYSLKNVSDVTGVSQENLLKVYKAFCATGKPDKAGTILYALGWTQHTVGVQNIRTSTLIQLLLGNIGVAGGGINALRGEPNVQGSTDHALLYHILPGYLPVPRASWQSLADYQKANTPVTTLKNSANWWGNRPKYMVSLLKGWFGDAATPENNFCYDLLAKLEPGEDPVAGALRELKEETGAVPDTFLPMGVTLPSPGCLSERLYLFLAKGLHMESQQLDEDEFLNVERIPFNEMVHRVMDGEIEDSKTIAAVLKAKVLLNL